MDNYCDICGKPTIPKDRLSIRSISHYEPIGLIHLTCLDLLLKFCQQFYTLVNVQLALDWDFYKNTIIFIREIKEYEKTK